MTRSFVSSIIHLLSWPVSLNVSTDDHELKKISALHSLNCAVLLIRYPKFENETAPFAVIWPNADHRLKTLGTYVIRVWQEDFT